MATHCAFYLKADSVESVADAIKTFYISSDYKYKDTIGTNLPVLYGKKFPVYGKRPNLFAIRKNSTDFITIDYNCFNVPTDLLCYLSKVYSPIINVIFQTTSEAYWFKYFKESTEVRSIGYADGEIYENIGTYFDFESDPIGIDENDDDESEPWFTFTEESIELYANKLGFTQIFNNKWDGSGITLKIIKKNILEKMFS